MTQHVPEPPVAADAPAPGGMVGASIGPGAVSVRPPLSEPGPLRLWILSDLRVDLAPFDLPDALPDFDAVVVAGGIGPGLRRSVRWLARALDGHRRDRPVVLVPGPAEYLDGVPVAEALADAMPIARDLGITLLHDASVRLGDPTSCGVHVLGATLWPSFGIEGAHNALVARAHARHRWSVRARATSAPGVPFYPHDAAGGHHRSRAFIEDALSSVVAAGYGHVPDPVVGGIRGGDRAVVVTAYPPSRSCLPPGLARPVLDPWRVCWHASDLDAVMGAWGAPVAWVHGQVPAACDLRIGRTRVVSNPFGRDPTAGFDPRRTITV